MSGEFERLTNAIVCPHCKGDIQLVVRSRITVVRGEVEIPVGSIAKPDGEKRITRAEAWVASLTPTQRGVIDEARETGILDALRTAVAFMPIGSRPAIVEKFLMTTLALAEPITETGEIPRVLLNRLRDAYPEGRLTVYKTSSILIVTLDSRLVGFLPKNILNERRPSKFHDRDPEDAGWFKTRFGYVAGKGPFYEEMRHRYLGEFQTVRN